MCIYFFNINNIYIKFILNYINVIYKYIYNKISIKNECRLQH